MSILEHKVTPWNHTLGVYKMWRRDLLHVIPPFAYKDEGDVRAQDEGGGWSACSRLLEELTSSRREKGQLFPHDWGEAGRSLDVNVMYERSMEWQEPAERHGTLTARPWIFTALPFSLSAGTRHGLSPFSVWHIQPVMYVIRVSSPAGWNNSLVLIVWTEFFSLSQSPKNINIRFFFFTCFSVIEIFSSTWVHYKSWYCVLNVKKKIKKRTDYFSNFTALQDFYILIGTQFVTKVILSFYNYNGNCL